MGKKMAPPPYTSLPMPKLVPPPASSARQVSPNAPSARPAATSHVRLRAHGFSPLFSKDAPVRMRAVHPVEDDAPAVVDAIADDQLTLTMDLLCLESAIDVLPYDPSTRAAAQTLAERLEDLAELRDAINAVYLDLFDARVALVNLSSANGSLGDYLRGLHAWSKAVVRAFEELSTGLRRQNPDWALLRTRLEDAQIFYLEDLERVISSQVVALYHEASELDDPRDPLHDFGAHVDELFASAAWLRTALEQRFG